MKRERIKKIKKDNSEVRFSIRKKILLLSLMAGIPFLIISVYLLISMSNYNKRYHDIVNNLAIANNYNINFKEEMDESLYKLVVGYVKFENISKKENLKNPYELIDNLRSGFTRLKEITTDYESAIWLDSLLRNIDTLKDRVDDIVESAEEEGQYDQNIQKLDNNIYILTELIQDDIQYYIYYQTRSMEEVTKELNRQIHAFLMVCAGVLAILALSVAAAAFLVASGILRPLRELYQATGEIAKGNFSVRTKITSQDEVAVLGQGFNEMASNMQMLVDKVREDEQKMRKADLRLLQEQINPHFLYNTLDTIVWLIETNEADRAVEMVVTLSDFFRIVLSKGKEFISIQMEEKHIHSYLQIQEMRYHDILDYEIRIEPELYAYLIPKLTLQPIVENALYHGIKYKRARGKILITGEKKEEKIYLTVKDDGVGMEEAELEKLKIEIQRPCKETERGFGLANVNERIRMYFGLEYGMEIKSKRGEGTTVSIVIPAVWKEEEKKEGQEE